MGTRRAASQRAYQSWGRYPPATPAAVERLAWRHALPRLRRERPVLAYGQGRSYGDACLNDGGVLLDTRGLDRFIHFDREAGLLRCEAGVSLGEVLAVVVPHGWFLPVTPGTKHVTVGGAVANDVHGKNHHVAGTFGRHVTRLELVRSSGERRELTPADDLFRATVGGLGLTGLITWVEFRLQRIASDRIEALHTPFRSLD
ncbi:MAG TPA: FAD-binding oxidoreductase, partial [Rubricoccaceae bacterium]|nr:FAD-binding oxidoreductase [Rubricoccaceae bacterium]